MENKLKKLYNYLVDNNYTDKQYHQQFPTIYHLRRELMRTTAVPDIRLVYLISPKKDFQLCVIQDIWVISILKNYQIHISGGIFLLK